MTPPHGTAKNRGDIVRKTHPWHHPVTTLRSSPCNEKEEEAPNQLLLPRSGAKRNIKKKPSQKKLHIKQTYFKDLLAHPTQKHMPHQPQEHQHLQFLATQQPHQTQTQRDKKKRHHRLKTYSTQRHTKKEDRIGRHAKKTSIHLSRRGLDGVRVRVTRVVDQAFHRLHRNEKKGTKHGRVGGVC